MVHVQHLQGGVLELEAFDGTAAVRLCVPRLRFAGPTEPICLAAWTFGRAVSQGRERGATSCTISPAVVEWPGGDAGDGVRVQLRRHGRFCGAWDDYVFGAEALLRPDCYHTPADSSRAVLDPGGTAMLAGLVHGSQEYYRCSVVLEARHGRLEARFAGGTELLGRATGDSCQKYDLYALHGLLDVAARDGAGLVVEWTTGGNLYARSHVSWGVADAVLARLIGRDNLP